MIVQSEGFVFSSSSCPVSSWDFVWVFGQDQLQSDGGGAGFCWSCGDGFFLSEGSFSYSSLINEIMAGNGLFCGCPAAQSAMKSMLADAQNSPPKVSAMVAFATMTSIVAAAACIVARRVICDSKKVSRYHPVALIALWVTAVTCVACAGGAVTAVVNPNDWDNVASAVNSCLGQGVSDTSTYSVPGTSAYLFFIGGFVIFLCAAIASCGYRKRPEYDNPEGTLLLMPPPVVAGVPIMYATPFPPAMQGLPPGGGQWAQQVPAASGFQYQYLPQEQQYQHVGTAQCPDAPPFDPSTQQPVEHCQPVQ